MNSLWPSLAVGAEMACIVVWLCVAIHFGPSVLRIMKSRANPWDRAGTFACLSGLVFIGYWLRWVELGQHVIGEMPLLRWWVCANVAALLLGVGTLFGFETKEVQRENIKIRRAVLLWFGVVVACCALAYVVQ